MHRRSQVEKPKARKSLTSRGWTQRGVGVAFACPVRSKETRPIATRSGNLDHVRQSDAALAESHCAAASINFSCSSLAARACADTSREAASGVTRTFGQRAPDVADPSSHAPQQGEPRDAGSRSDSLARRARCKQNAIHSRGARGARWFRFERALRKKAAGCVETRTFADRARPAGTRLCVEKSRSSTAWRRSITIARLESATNRASCDDERERGGRSRAREG